MHLHFHSSQNSLFLFITSMAQTNLQIMLLILFVISSSFLFFSSANPSSSCSRYVFRNKDTYTSCVDLPVLDSFIHWNFNESSRNLQIAYRHVHVTPSTWVAWGLNPNSKGMVGTQAFVAFQKADGNVRVYNLPIMGYRTDMLPGELSFKVKNLSASYLDDEIIIFASLTLPYNYTTVNQVWQDGQVVNDSPTMHKVTGPNVKSMATLDLLSGQYTRSSGSVNQHMTLKISHGIINTISWGMMMPLGAVIARYLKVFQSQSKAWFIIHRACQSLAYLIGTGGFITGIILGRFSPGLTYSIHLTVGIILISLASFQVLVAYFCRPGKDHRYRIWWNAFHYVVGYSTISLSIYDIFKGFSILKTKKTWENAYMGFVLGLASVAVVLETYKWIIVLKTRNSIPTTNESTGRHDEKIVEDFV